jgi:murein DD-endopeptidase MepM/ murein hydrolase activator NlpD
LTRFGIIALSVIAGLGLLWFGRTSRAQEAPKGLEGTWQGALGAGSPHQLRLVLTITKSSDGKYSGVLDSVDQGATVPLDTVTLNGNQLRFEITSIGGVYEGQLNEDQTKLTGHWTQTAAPNPQPLSFARTSSEASATAARAAPAPKRKSLDAPIDVRVPEPPTVFRADGKSHLAYELHLTNFSSQDCALTRVEVLRGDGDHQSLAQYEGADLVGSVARPGAQGLTGTDKLRLGPGLSGVVYLWVDLNADAEVPAEIEHRISVKVADSDFTVQCARVAVKRDVALIGPPLRGGDWMAANGPSNTSAHRRALIPIGGSARISQRFAIDWVQLRDDGNTFTGDPKDNKNYRAYDSEVLAVADGTVSEVKDGIPQNVPGIDSRAVPITLGTIGGNHIILDLGDGRYAFYAHLQPGSLRVKPGDRVRRGEVLALVGNSGNSTEPHLHFQLCDANSPLGSEGLPYALESFEVQGSGTMGPLGPAAGADWKGTKSGPPQKREREIPAENEVVRFPPGS